MPDWTAFQPPPSRGGVPAALAESALAKVEIADSRRRAAMSKWPTRPTTPAKQQASGGGNDDVSASHQSSPIRCLGRCYGAGCRFRSGASGAGARRRDPPGLPDQHVGHAHLLPAALRRPGEARAEVRGVCSALGQPHHAADGGAAGGSGHLRRPLLHSRPRQGWAHRHRRHRARRPHHAHHGAQGPGAHQGRRAQGPQGRQPDGLLGRQYFRRPDRPGGRPEEGRLPGSAAWT